MKLKNRYLKSLLDKCDQRSEGCDYLQLSTNRELAFERYFSLLDNDNSSTAHIEGENYVYTLSIDFSKKHRSLLVSIAIQDISYPIMKISQFNRGGGCIKVRYSIHILGTAFRLIETRDITNLDEIIGDVFSAEAEIVSSSNITRIDYRFDISYKEKKSIPKCKNLIDARKGTHISKYKMNSEDVSLHEGVIERIKSGGEITYYQTREDYKDNICNGWTVGKRNSNTIRFRCYEKLIDTVAKGKFGLYSDYFQYANVYRLEGEFCNYFCRKEDGQFFSFNELKLLIDKCRSWYGIGLYQSNYLYRADSLSIKSAESINRYVRNFQNRGYKIYENNMNPIHLHFEGLLERGVDPGMLSSLLEEQRIWMDSVLSLRSGYR